MARGEHAVGQFTRGWEVAGNFWAMARTSVVRQLTMSVALGVVLGGLWFESTLSDTQHTMLSDYTKCTLAGSLKPNAVGTYESFGAGARHPHAQACAVIAQRFGGRSVSFLGWQCLGRALLCAAVAFVGLTWLLTAYGRRLSRSRHLRGAKILDVEAEHRKSPRRRFVVALAVGMTIATAVLAWELGTTRLALLGDFVTSDACARWPGVASLLSANSDGVSVWFDGVSVGDEGFRTPSAMRAALAPVFGGHSPGVWFAQWLGLSAVFVGLSLLIQRSSRLHQQARKEVADLHLAKVAIPRNVEGYHFLFCGSPGSGKSTAIKEMLDQIRKRGEKAVIYDCSGEYISVFYRPERDIILNPLDSRTARWTLWNETRRREDYYTLARSVFPPEGKDPFWADAGAQLLASVAEILEKEGETTNKALADLLLRSPLVDLYERLEGTTGARFMDPDAGPMPTNVLATVASKLGVWDTLSEAPSNGDPFSIRKFIETDDDRWLYLSTRRDQHETLKPLLSLWCDVAATAILSLPVANQRPPRKWVFLDEIASLQRLPALPPLLDLGRKHGGSVVLGLQSIAQLRAAYGHDGAAALASEPQTWLVLRSVEPETAQWLERALCSVEQEEVQESLSMGPNAMRDGVSLQHSKAVRPVVLASEIMTLPDLAGFMKKPKDATIYRVKYNLRQRPSVAAGFIDTTTNQMKTTTP